MLVKPRLFKTRLGSKRPGSHPSSYDDRERDIDNITYNYSVKAGITGNPFMAPCVQIPQATMAYIALGRQYQEHTMTLAHEDKTQ